MLKIISYTLAAAALFQTVATGCALNLSSLELSHIPTVNLEGVDLKHYQDDVAACQRKILAQYQAMPDKRNQDRDFRQCLIDKGYMLLS